MGIWNLTHTRFVLPRAFVSTRCFGKVQPSHVALGVSDALVTSQAFPEAWDMGAHKHALVLDEKGDMLTVLSTLD